MLMNYFQNVFKLDYWLAKQNYFLDNRVFFIFLKAKHWHTWPKNVVLLGISISSFQICLVVSKFQLASS